MITLVRTTAIRRITSKLKQAVHSASELSRLEIVSLAFVILAVGYLTTIAVDYQAGWSASEPVPEYPIRLQIVDGSGDAVNLGEARKLFSDELAKADFELVRRERFAGRILPETILISRGEKSSDAEKLARFLGLDEGRIVRKPLDRNDQNISVTLVLGEDFDESVLDRFRKKETQSSS